MTDPIADMLTQIRNAYLVKKPEVVLPHSKFKQSLAAVLANHGWLGGAQTIEENGMKLLKLGLKYDETGQPAIESVQRVSKPGQRIYFGSQNLRRFRSRPGTVIVSTSRGIMTDREAGREKIGGEVICQIW